MTLCDFKIGSTYSVDVTHINDPHSFYVRSADARDYMDAIERPGSPVIAREIKHGQRVVYKSNTLGKYVRGDIRFINWDGETTECVMFAIDYGCLEQFITLDQIHSLDPWVECENQHPPLALHCLLYLCESIDDTFSNKVIDTMKFFVGEHTARIKVINKMDNKLVVELYTVDCPGDVSTMMGLLNYTALTKHKNTVNRFYNSFARPGTSASAGNLTKQLSYKHRDLNVGDILQVRVQTGSSLSSFYVAELDEYKKYLKGIPSFKTYCMERQMQKEDILPGRHCAVKISHPTERYERAIVKEITDPDSKAILQLVDWGKDVESSFMSIKPVVSEIYFAQPIVAIYCTTEEDQAWSTGLPTFLYPGYEFVIKIMEVGNGFHKPHRVNIYPWKM